MTVRQLFSKARERFSQRSRYGFDAELDCNGLIDCSQEGAVGVLERDEIEIVEPSHDQYNQIAVQEDRQIEREDRTDVPTEAFERLIGQLQGINNSFNRQMEQNERILERVQKLPEMLESLPVEAENQRQMVYSMMDQMKAQSDREEKIAETLRDIPYQTSRQTNTLVDMNQKLSASAQVDAQLADGFNRFNSTLGNLNKTSTQQSDAIAQMNKTFAASDRYMKHLVNRQNKRFAWMFFSGLGVCTFAVIAVIVTLVLVFNG